ncbi:MAG: polyprenyl synthetase family protein [Bacteroidales bacterium]|nr:polyprenyl synthetase family protein [Bacteroidales bacterium]MCB8999802.1 polyprenyl synthetase family protein [Bacteroidales bacterium]
MSELNQIREPIKLELKEFEKHFRKSLKSSVPLFDTITNYILRKKGKQMRPTFVLLSARMFGEIGPSSYTAASLIELLHTASLVHDDVVDESYERRGFFSINALWKSKVAVLVGDFLLAKGLLLSVENREYELLEITSEAVKEMSEGELLQIQKSWKLNIEMDDYFEIIRKKTAALIAACTACGAKSAGASDTEVQLMKEFGELTGIAFQIKDDLFDYERNGKIGKPTANDIKEKKMTLPLIYALDVCPSGEKKKMLSIIKHHNRNADKVDEVIDFVKNYGGLDFAEKKMIEYKEKALAKINSFPDSESKTALIQLLNFSISRKE